MGTVAGDVAGADHRIGDKKADKRKVKNVKRISRTRFKDFVTKTKVEPSKKSKSKSRKKKHKGRQYDD